jgi:hypothetical protein
MAFILWKMKDEENSTIYHTLVIRLLTPNYLHLQLYPKVILLEESQVRRLIIDAYKKHVIVPTLHDMRQAVGVLTDIRTKEEFFTFRGFELNSSSIVLDCMRKAVSYFLLLVEFRFYFL